MSDLLASLRSYRLSDLEVPLMGDRTPFRHLSDAALYSAVQLATSIGRKRGILSNSIYRTVKKYPAISGEFVRFEAHVNVTVASVDVINRLVELGFEEDDFVVLEPSCYSKNFTLSFDVDRHRREQLKMSRETLLLSCGRAADILKNNEQVDGFIEAEVISSKFMRRFDVSKNGTSVGMDYSMLPEMKTVCMPRNDEEAEAAGIDIFAFKKADIHIKIPFSEFSSDIVPNATEALSELTVKLVGAGFYRIVSCSSNTIFTAQFIDSSTSRKLFDIICRASVGSNIVESVIMEPCIWFWRKESVVNGRRVLAEISPVLVVAS